MPHSQLRVLIADDTPEVRHELRIVLSLVDQIEIVGEAANGVEAIHLTHSLNPDVVLMDIEMPKINGIEATRQIKQENAACRVVILTVHDTETQRKRATQAGAESFLVKGAAIDSLVKVILE